ncbi:TPA: hypothetical protein G8M32_005045 [Salmonella enterica]|nr:hypothetical protein [Salmonella enterica]ECI3887996.1 hypothetical protein [Salmonella enterica subsp. enterica serovar Gombe]HAF5791818.1 hypothetical protein [Salmonella enterica]
MIRSGESMKLKPMLLLFIIALTGCVQKHEIFEPLSVTCLPSNKVSVRYYDNPDRNMDEAAYRAKINQIISSKIYNPSLYKGQQCTAILNARNKIASVESGDVRICSALLYAIASSSFPSIPAGIHEQDSNALMSIPVVVKF